MRLAPLRSLLVAVLALSGAACGSTVPVVLEAPPVPEASTEVQRAVGQLLSNDAERSLAAERRLLVLDEPGRRALTAHAARIPRERDPRWLHVLDEHGLLPALKPILSPGERVAFLVWKAGRPERSFAMKAQAGLVAEAQRDPAPLLAELARGGPSVAVLCVALAVAGRRDAVPALVERYLAETDEDARLALSEALAQLVSEELRPRLGGTQEQRERDAAALLERWRVDGGPNAAPPGAGHA